jgi:hypothetical protein
MKTAMQASERERVTASLTVHAPELAGRDVSPLGQGLDNTVFLVDDRAADDLLTGLFDLVPGSAWPFMAARAPRGSLAASSRRQLHQLPPPAPATCGVAAARPCSRFSVPQTALSRPAAPPVDRGCRSRVSRTLRSPGRSSPAASGPQDRDGALLSLP